ESLIDPLRRLLKFDRGLAVGFERPTFLANDEHCRLPTDMLGRGAAVLFDALESLPMRHRRQRPRERNAFSLQRRRIFRKCGHGLVRCLWSVVSCWNQWRCLFHFTITTLLPSVVSSN